MNRAKLYLINEFEDFVFQEHFANDSDPSFEMAVEQTYKNIESVNDVSLGAQATYRLKNPLKRNKAKNGQHPHCGEVVQVYGAHQKGQGE